MKTLLIGLILGFISGVWVGAVLIEDDTILSNPFAEKSMPDKIIEAGEKLLEEGDKALNEGKKLINSN